MKLRWQTARAALMAVVLSLCGCTKEKVEESLLYPDDRNYLPWVGRNVAEIDFHFIDLEGREVDLAKYRGKVLMLDFWATWGPPCMEMLPAKLAAYKKYHHLGFEIVGITGDLDKDDLLKVIKQHGITWPQYFHPDGPENAAKQKFGITHFPSLWLVDKKGVIRYISAGRDMEGKIESLLSEGAPPAQSPGKSGGWTDKLMSALGSKPKEDPIAAMKELMEAPDQYMDVKNITITATRRIATLKTSTATHQLVIGKEIKVPTESGEVLVTCKEINRDGLVLQVTGQDRPIKLAF